MVYPPPPPKARQGIARRPRTAVQLVQPWESPPFAWLHFVMMIPLVGQPVFFDMQSQTVAKDADLHSVGMDLQLLGFHAFAVAS